MQEPIKILSPLDIAQALHFVIIAIVVETIPKGAGREVAFNNITNRLHDASFGTVGGCQAILAELSNSLLNAET